jgi:hypothetical protein
MPEGPVESNEAINCVGCAGIEFGPIWTVGKPIHPSDDGFDRLSYFWNPELVYSSAHELE